MSERKSVRKGESERKREKERAKEGCKANVKSHTCPSSDGSGVSGWAYLSER